MLQNKIKNSDLSDEDKANLNNILEHGDQEFVEEYLKDVKMTHVYTDTKDKIYTSDDLRSYGHVENSTFRQYMFYCNNCGTDGRGILTDKGFVVLKGSIARRESVSSILKTSKGRYRTKLIESGVMSPLRESPDHFVVFEKNYLFETPSAASMVLLGRGSNGWTIWKTEDGRTLEEVVSKNHWKNRREIKEINAIKETSANKLSTQEICDAYEQGKIVSEIAKKHDCTNTSIRNHLKKGGYMFDQSKNVWTKEGKESVGRNMGAFRRLVNYLIEGFNAGAIQTNQIITVEMIAKQFNISREAASNVLSYASGKEVFGLRRIGKGVYQITHQKIHSEVTKVQHVQHAVPVVGESVIVEEKIDDDLNNLLRVSKFAKEMGGLNKLKDLCEILLKI